VNPDPAAYRAKMTAARLAGTSPDVYHTGLAVNELGKACVAAELPVFATTIGLLRGGDGRNQLAECASHDASGVRRKFQMLEDRQLELCSLD